MAALLIPGAVFFVGIFLVMLSQAHSSSVRPAAESSGLSSVLTAPLHLLVRAWERLVRATISRFAASHLIPLVRWFSAANALVVLGVGTIADAAEDFATAVERLRHHVIPREARKAAAPATAQAKAAHRTADRADAKATATSKGLVTYRTRTNTTLRHHTHALDVTLPREIAGVRRREETLSRDQAKLRERTKSLESGALKTFEWIRAHPFAGVTGVFAGAVAIALARLGFGFLRCRSWQKLGRRVTCGMGAWLHSLLDLIGVFALALLGVLKPEALAAVSVSAVDVLEPQLKTLLGAAPSTAQLEKDIERFSAFLGIR